MFLAPLHVLITRPLHQARPLSSCLLKLGYQTSIFPVIEIHPFSSSAQDNHSRLLKNEVDFFIFVSANAVLPALPYLVNQRARLLAIGPGTREALEAADFPAHNQPETDFSSAGLLKLPELQQVLNKKIVIFSGQRSKPLLLTTLQARGAKVKQIAVYQRIIPQMDITSLLEYWEKNIDIVVTTSKESLKNWFTLLGKTGQSIFAKKPLIVITPSMKKTALTLKLGNPILLATDATNTAIIKVLQTWSQHATAARNQ